ncbi:MAG: Panacea domain-containing protein [Syntrophales bacterium]
MIPYQKEKIENAICYFAVEHRRMTRHPLYQTFLYKYLALLDFGYFRKYGTPVLGLTYIAMPMGPVPKELYEKRDDPNLSTCFSFQKDENNNIKVRPRAVPDLSFFSRRELAEMDRLVEIYGKGYISSGLVSDASHEEILAWRRTWAESPGRIIDFALEFPDDVTEKPEDRLSFPEEVYLTQRGIDRC